MRASPGLNILCSDFVLAGVRLPACLFEAKRDALPRDEEGSYLADLHVASGRIAAVAPAGLLGPEAVPRIDADGRQVWPRLVDMHAHLDKGQVIPRVRTDGTLAGGAMATAADRRRWTREDLARRMGFALRCAYAHGVGAIRTHLDSNHDKLDLVWEIFRDLRTEWAGRVDLQGVGLAPLDLFLTPAGVAVADLVARSGGVLGGVTDGIGQDWNDPGAVLDPALDRFLVLAAERGLDVDLHVDQTDDPAAFALPAVARAVMRSRLPGRVVCGHCVNLALQPDGIREAAIALAHDAGLAFVSLPTPMMYLMDRAPGRTPRWRGVTAALELMEAGLPLAIGGDNCRDAWYPYGDHDMVDTFRQAVRVLHLDHDLPGSPALVGPVPADIIGAHGVGRIAIGGPADLILFQARSLNELMCRPQADRTVLHAGRVVSPDLPDYAELTIGEA